ncbi:glycerol-3-phosphate cytidylyltransferase [Enterococcus asini ATCC 700915]|uniref:Glycerol-3-phosphate cytidylyltransferase n=1 Tax=Enterococcus asini ATCC 700915 TaxID=1158606 RepID=R2SDY6_9ENTE|nr:MULTISPECIES: glycerol-3-phosphate cytidylyltransferase [Enterococcus]EGP5124442.1 glycerol-3-phosphate cytidylyltransferase [Enterococcus faecium]EGV5849979.1 glycerol-3-phosphate cytidylyltransferase [Enterococcus faecium]EME3494077.1 glycerol-3-phosphate cytidylyltransferase [Enterococcus faecium]EME3514294.1 glycerol-3-phosphate cytidylyltransferase [Enterococcus faecium]EOH86354.1 glycerol-3-phosphate cytidylyltransferase [Enterococcus asini ATCC 700915]
MKRIITYGTFDLLHYGHINLLKRAKEQGDYLVVALSTDEFNWDEKQKKCYFSYEKRKQLLEAIRYVDLVIPEKNWEQKTTDIELYHIDKFVMGDDWAGKFDFIEDQTEAEVIYLPRTPEISTTQIKRDLEEKNR